jgi:hypothetical protein
MLACPHTNQMSLFVFDDIRQKPSASVHFQPSSFPVKFDIVKSLKYSTRVINTDCPYTACDLYPTYPKHRSAKSRRWFRQGASLAAWHPAEPLEPESQAYTQPCISLPYESRTLRPLSMTPHLRWIRIPRDSFPLVLRTHHNGDPCHYRPCRKHRSVCRL